MLLILVMKYRVNFYFHVVLTVMIYLSQPNETYHVTRLKRTRTRSRENYAVVSAWRREKVSFTFLEGLGETKLSPLGTDHHLSSWGYITSFYLIPPTPQHTEHFLPGPRGRCFKVSRKIEPSNSIANSFSSLLFTNVLLLISY